jgi:hypothetical protein
MDPYSTYAVQTTNGCDEIEKKQKHPTVEILTNKILTISVSRSLSCKTQFLVVPFNQREKENKEVKRRKEVKKFLCFLFFFIWFSLVRL